VVGSHSALIFFSVFVCSLVNFHGAVFFLGLLVTVTCMVSFGDSKHEPVKPLHSLLDVTPLKLALSAKCTIHDVTAWCSFISVFFLSICYYFSVCRAWGQTHLLTSFGCAVGFLSDLAMCVAVKRWHVLLIVFHFYLIYNVFHCRFFVFLNRHLYSCFGYL